MTVSAQTVGGGTAQGALSLSWIVAAFLVGTLIEWYDFYLYGTFAVFSPNISFPRDEGQEIQHFRLSARHRIRVARLLSLRDAGTACREAMKP